MLSVPFAFERLESVEHLADPKYVKFWGALFPTDANEYSKYPRLIGGSYVASSRASGNNILFSNLRPPQKHDKGASRTQRTYSANSRTQCTYNANFIYHTSYDGSSF